MCARPSGTSAKDDTKLSIFKEASIISSYEVELVLRRTIPHYHVELWLRNKIWYSWTADASPYDDLVYGGKSASLSGIVGNWGSALLSLTW